MPSSIGPSRASTPPRREARPTLASSTAHAGLRSAARVDGGEAGRDRRRLPGAARARRPRASRRRGDARQPGPQADWGSPANRDRATKTWRGSGRSRRAAVRAARRQSAGRSGRRRGAARSHRSSTRIFQRQALAAWYLDRALSPILQPTDEQLARCFARRRTRSRGGPSTRSARTSSRWFVHGAGPRSGDRVLPGGAHARGRRRHAVNAAISSATRAITCARLRPLLLEGTSE